MNHQAIEGAKRNLRIFSHLKRNYKIKHENAYFKILSIAGRNIKVYVIIYL